MAGRYILVFRLILTYNDQERLWVAEKIVSARESNQGHPKYMYKVLLPSRSWNSDYIYRRKVVMYNDNM